MWVGANSMNGEDCSGRELKGNQRRMIFLSLFFVELGWSKVFSALLWTWQGKDTSSPLTLTEESCWIYMAHVMSLMSVYMHMCVLHGSKADSNCKDVVFKYPPV